MYTPWFESLPLHIQSTQGYSITKTYINRSIFHRESGVVTNLLARVNSSNITDVNYQLLLSTPITVTGALLAGLGGCSVSGMSLRLNVSIIESESKGIQLTELQTSSILHTTTCMHACMCYLQSWLTPVCVILNLNSNDKGKLWQTWLWFSITSCQPAASSSTNRNFKWWCW